MLVIAGLLTPKNWERTQNPAPLVSVPDKKGRDKKGDTREGGRTVRERKRINWCYESVRAGLTSESDEDLFHCQTATSDSCKVTYK